MFEPADGLFGTFVTKKWLVDELSTLHHADISEATFSRIGETEGSFSRVCLMECKNSGTFPEKLIVKIPTCLTYVENRKRRGWTQGDYSYVKDLLKQYHNTETLFYQHAQDIPGVPRTFLRRPLADDDRGVICMEYMEGCRTLPVYENISVEQMKSALKLYSVIQYRCHSIPDSVRAQMDRNVFQILAGTTLSLKTLTQRFHRIADWAPELTSVISDVIRILPRILDHSAVARLHSSCPFRPLFVHGDLYSCNILWRDGKAEAIIDYQLSSLTMSHFGNPVEDLLRLFCIGLSPADRKLYTTILLQYYCDEITSLLPELNDVITVVSLTSWYNEIFPVATLWTIVSLHASFEAATSQLPEDEARTKSVVEKIHAVAVDILEKSIN
ncbi:hypothetical protein Y032_0036g3186 [Ancylostoma ceylanicum]|uniref:CHK kinase-like domain-containing protein n=1 Tax=Ancylostoma ceylanicum TaxID=53326 RepID=A0A016UJH3_9BILA|nr:hypothetical protein Y032_0036g3186 [Ancylostoma ceylanicum]